MAALLIAVHKLSIASSLSLLYFIMQQTEIIKTVPDLLNHILFQLNVTHQQISIWGFLRISTVPNNLSEEMHAK